MATVRLDAHAHLYDSYSLTTWGRSALRNLQDGEQHIVPAVIVVDRQGQDSFVRLQRESSGWHEQYEGSAGIYHVDDADLLVIRGAQYAAQERIEVLGLGCSRSELEGKPAADIVAAVRDAGGIACLPWSPGKWLGARGIVVRGLLEHETPQVLSVGDVAIRSSLGPPSSLLARARSLGYRVFCGSDPLPFSGEERWVGSFGQELEVESTDSKEHLVGKLLERLRDPASRFAPYGRRNSVTQALRRFVVSNVSRPSVVSSH